MLYILQMLHTQGLAFHGCSVPLAKCNSQYINIKLSVRIHKATLKGTRINVLHPHQGEKILFSNDTLSKQPNAEATSLNTRNLKSPSRPWLLRIPTAWIEALASASQFFMKVSLPITDVRTLGSGLHLTILMTTYLNSIEANRVVTSYEK